MALAGTRQQFLFSSLLFFRLGFPHLRILLLVLTPLLVFLVFLLLLVVVPGVVYRWKCRRCFRCRCCFILTARCCFAFAVRRWLWSWLVHSIDNYRVCGFRGAILALLLLLLLRGIFAIRVVFPTRADSYSYAPSPYGCHLMKKYVIKVRVREAPSRGVVEKKTKKRGWRLVHGEKRGVTFLSPSVFVIFVKNHPPFW